MLGKGNIEPPRGKGVNTTGGNILGRINIGGNINNYYTIEDKSMSNGSSLIDTASLENGLLWYIPGGAIPVANPTFTIDSSNNSYCYTFDGTTGSGMSNVALMTHGAEVSGDIVCISFGLVIEAVIAASAYVNIMLDRTLNTATGTGQSFVIEYNGTENTYNLSYYNGSSNILIGTYDTNDTLNMVFKIDKTDNSAIISVNGEDTAIATIAYSSYVNPGSSQWTAIEDNSILMFNPSGPRSGISGSIKVGNLRVGTDYNVETIDALTGLVISDEDVPNVLEANTKDDGYLAGILYAMDLVRRSFIRLLTVTNIIVTEPSVIKRVGGYIYSQGSDTTAVNADTTVVTILPTYQYAISNNVVADETSGTIEIQETGTYRVKLVLTLLSTTLSVLWSIMLRTTTGSSIAVSDTYFDTAGEYKSVVLESIMEFSEGDIIAAYLSQSSGSTVTMSIRNRFLSVERIS